ncbi:MAG: hypothetical protein GX550_09165 [Syntrophomonadaceae bacterium]|nr:hypothetical protein [Syntrophomonadaceae bacterium]
MMSSSKVIKSVHDQLENYALRPRLVVEPEFPADHRIIKQAEEEAKKIVAKAQEEANRILQESQKKIWTIEQESYEKSYKRAQQDVWQEVKERTEMTYEAARQVLVQAEEIRQQIYQETESEIIDLVVKIAEKIVCKQLDLVPETIVDIVRLACEQQREAKNFMIYVHPDQVDMLRMRRKELVTRLNAPSRVQIIGDGNLKQGECRVETEQGHVDATLGAMLEQLGLAIKGSIL